MSNLTDDPSGKSLYGNTKGVYFNGDPMMWNIIEALVQADATHYGYDDIMYGDAICPKKSDAKSDEEKALVKLNHLGFARLLKMPDPNTELGRVAFDLINGSRDADYPRGNLKQAWDNLQEKYRDKSVTTTVQAKREYQNHKMKAGQSPDVYINRLTELMRRYNLTIEEAKKTKPNSIVAKLSPITVHDMLADILVGIPKELSAQLPRLEKEFEDGSLTIAEAQSQLMSIYKREKAYDEEDDNSSETALLVKVTQGLERMSNDEVAAVFKTVFKGNCRKCGRRGHKASDCTSGGGGGRTGKRRAGTGFRGKCNKCGRPGHMARDCPESKHENAHHAADDDADEDESDDSDEEELGFMLFDEEYDEAIDDVDEQFENDTSEGADDAIGSRANEHDVGRTNPLRLWVFPRQEPRDDESDNDDESEGSSTADLPALVYRDVEDSSDDESEGSSTADLPALVYRDVDDSSDDESEGSNEVDLPGLALRDDSDEGDSDDDSYLSSIADWRELMDPNQYAIRYYPDDVVAMFTDGSYAYAPTNSSVHTTSHMSSDVLEDAEYLQDSTSLSTASTVRSTPASSVTSIAVQDDSIPSSSFEETRAHAGTMAVFRYTARMQQELDSLPIFTFPPYESYDLPNASTTGTSGDNGTADDSAEEIQAVGDYVEEENALITVDDEAPTEEEVAAPCIIDGKVYQGFTDDTAVGDSGSSTHLWDDDKYLYNVEKLKNERARGVGTAELTVKGDMPVIFKQVDGKCTRGTLEGIKVAPTQKHKLLSITAAMSKGATLSSDSDNNIVLTLNGKEIKFDRRIRTKSGNVQGVEILPDLPRLRQLREQEAERALHMRDNCPSRQGIDIQRLHRQLGHPSLAIIRSTANAKGWKLTGSMSPCQDCALAKARQRNVSKSAADYGELLPGEMMSLDISSPGESLGGTKHFCLMQCVKTDKTFYYFVKAKSHMPQKVVATIKQLKRRYGIIVKIIRCDGAGENKTLQKLCEEQELDIEFQVTAPNTGQHNPVERKIATVYTGCRAMSNDAGLSKEEFKSIWTYAMALLIQMMNEMVKPGQTKSPNELFYGDDVSTPSVFGTGPPMNTFGEVCVSAKRTKHPSKFEDRGKLAIWIGPVVNSSKSTHYLYSLTSKRVIKSRDVIFLNQTYATWKAERALKQAQRNELRTTNTVMIPATDDDDEDDAPILRQPIINSTNYVSDDDSEPTPHSNDESFETAHEELPSSASSDQMSEGSPPPSPPPAPSPSAHFTDPTSKLYRELQRLNCEWNPTLRPVDESGRTNAQDANESSDVESSANNDESTADNESGRTDDDVDSEMVDANGDSDLDMVDVADIALMMHDQVFEEVNVSRETSSSTSTTTTSTTSSTTTPSSITITEPSNFYDAWNNSNPRERELWRAAIRKEFKDYKDRDCFKLVKKSSVPKNRRRIKCKWVFKIKRDLRHRARLCACGYSQIPGVDFDQFTSPVLNDISLRVMILLLMMNPRYIHRVCDVETAFLYGRIKEQIFMDLPPGYEVVQPEVNREEDCVELLASIYGTVQAALMYFEMWSKTLRDMGFQGGNVDPCLYFRTDQRGSVFIAVYVDDNLIIGDEDAVLEVISTLKKAGFVLKTDETLDDYLSCKISFNRDRTKCIVHQPHIMKKVRKIFGDMVSNTNFVTPGTPNQHIANEQDPSNVISAEQHALYRQLVGLLNYAVKLTRPDLANPVRNLGRALNAPGPLAWKEGLRVAKFYLDTEGYGLLMVVRRKCRMSGKWILIVYSDSDHAGDPESRRSISGFVLFLNGVPICYRSKAQATVSLSSSEAEWIALSEAVKEIVFVVQLLRDIGIKVDTPVIVKVDNIGAIHMAENVTNSARTRHIDIRTKFVREYNSGSDPLIKIVFCKSEDNTSDICTKNLSRELHEKHSKNLVGKVDWDKWTCK